MWMPLPSTDFLVCLTIFNCLAKWTAETGRQKERTILPITSFSSDNMLRKKKKKIFLFPMKTYIAKFSWLYIKKFFFFKSASKLSNLHNVISNYTKLLHWGTISNIILYLTSGIHVPLLSMKIKETTRTKLTN